jgi:soluble lytic murein transglycosylase-like protein
MLSHSSSSTSSTATRSAYDSRARRIPAPRRVYSYARFQKELRLELYRKRAQIGAVFFRCMGLAVFAGTQVHLFAAVADVVRPSHFQLLTARIQRDESIIAYSAKYHIGADIAGTIYDVSTAESVDPDLAFRLVRVESEFNPRATSPVGARGLTQVMPATAQFFIPGVTVAQLYDPTTNLRAGLRYFKGLVREQHGDLTLALLVYNRGPVAVQAALDAGIDPRNGYERRVLKGYHGPGVLSD